MPLSLQSHHCYDLRLTIYQLEEYCFVVIFLRYIHVLLSNILSGFYSPHDKLREHYIFTEIYRACTSSRLPPPTQPGNKAKFNTQTTSEKCHKLLYIICNSVPGSPCKEGKEVGIFITWLVSRRALLPTL